MTVITGSRARWRASTPPHAGPSVLRLVRGASGRCPVGRSCGRRSAVDAMAARAQLAAVRERVLVLRERARDLRARSNAELARGGRSEGPVPEALVEEFARLQDDFAALVHQSRGSAFDADAHELFVERAEAFLAAVRDRGAVGPA